MPLTQAYSVPQALTGKTLTDVFMGTTLQSISATTRDITLTASTNFIVDESIEISGSYTLEIPATSSLEVGSTAFGPQYLNPVGEVKMFGSNVIPSGWLLCNGANVSRTTYASLFAVIGVTYGAGDGSTTFGLPNFQGRTPLGVGTATATGATAWTLGQTPTTGAGGEQTHAQTSGELATHTHGLTRSSGTGDASKSRISTVANGDTVPGVNAIDILTMANAGSGTGANILSPVVVVNFIIKY